MPAKSLFAALPAPSLVQPNAENLFEEDPERLAWLALTLTPGLGSRRILQAVERVGSALRVTRLPLTALEAQRFPAPAVQFLADGQAWRAATEEAARLRALGAAFLCFTDAPTLSGCRTSLTCRRCCGRAAMSSYCRSTALL